MEIKEILKTSKNIAVVGLSDKPERPSYSVAEYLASVGYKIFPVNPMIKEWEGQKVYSSLLEIKEKIDIVDVFRKSEDIPPVADDATKISAKTIWLQLGITNFDAEKKAREAGLNVVSNKCIKIEHQRICKP